MSRSLLAITMLPCEHKTERQRLMKLCNTSDTLINIFEEVHGPFDIKTSTISVRCSQDIQNTNSFQAEGSASVGDIISMGLKSIEFECTASEEATVAKNIVDSTTKMAMDAFQILMAGGRAFVDQKTSSAGSSSVPNQKDVLFNKIVDDFKRKRLDFPRCSVVEEGKYIIQVMTNALWYITNHHSTINDAARRKDVLPIPPCFEGYKDMNDEKRKKKKKTSMNSNELESHSQALYSLLLKPVMKSSAAFSKLHSDILNLAHCLHQYSVYLQDQTTKVTYNHNLPHPVRTVGEHTTVEHRRKSSFGIQQKYILLDKEVSESDTEVFFDESKHVSKPFENNLQRFRFFADLQLSVPIDIFRFCPGSSVMTTVCIMRVNENRTEPEMLTQAARVVMRNKHKFLEFHTRAQKRAFKEKLDNVVHVSPSVASFIYKELTLDSATAAHPDTQERLRLIFLGEQGLVADLRHLNQGRPSSAFDVFFEKLANHVEEVTAADDRRHGTAHLCEWISLSDMIEKAKESCPENTRIPSKSLVRLQFAPRNPYAKSAWDFTSKIDVQYKIQRRQLRLSHPDEHYCNAQFKYMKEMAIDLKSRCNIVMVCCDDKAKVPIGEPGFAVSTGVRGKRTIAPSSTTLESADHDMVKSSLTPSVTLQVNVPDSTGESFVRGKVGVTVNDSVFEQSSPFRHAVTLYKILSTQNDIHVLLKYSDGGTDHRNTLESVKCSAICLFKELNLDLLVLARCAPGHSWRNPAERIMSILNLGLQNCAMERQKCNDATENTLKKCGSMKEIRAAASKHPDLQQAYKESVEPVQATIRNRFARLKLKDEPFLTFDPMTELEIDVFKRHLRELFPSLNLQNLQKNHTKKVKSYIEWTNRHCRERHYTYQIRKCDDANCCLPRRTPDDVKLDWLPDPVLDESGEHFKTFPEVVGTETDETARPTFKVQNQIPRGTKRKARKRTHSPEVDPMADPTEEPMADPTEEPMADPMGEPMADPMDDDGEEPASCAFTAQNARGVVNCVECRKPRVYYSQLKLSGRQQLAVAMSISDFDYTCGAPLTDPSVTILQRVAIRKNISCAHPIEVSYYGGTLQLDTSSICCRCGGGDGEVDQGLKARYKTVLPLCEDCKSSGHTAVAMRPYGKPKK